jgi:hypothetical protein
MNKTTYEQEKKRISEEIWSLISPENTIVIDFGVGENANSTQKLIEKGAHVIAVDRDIEALQKHKNVNALFVQCNFENMPFKPGSADAAVFCYTLHEINPSLHELIISRAASIATTVVIVEPLPGISGPRRDLEELWREAMHAVGKFEDYKPSTYWETLIKTCGFTELAARVFEKTQNIPPDVVKDIVRMSLEWWEKDGVPEELSYRMKDFLKYTHKEGLRELDTVVITGKTKDIRR